MQTTSFLQTVITSDEGWLCLAAKDYESWRESWFRWPDAAEQVGAVADLIKADNNVYFTSHLFSEKQSKKAYALPSRTIQADLDHAELATIPVPPTVLVQTSPGRHQGYWIVDTLQSVETLEALGRRIAYGVPDCDKTGWPVGHKVRLPGTLNHKYESPHNVEVASVAIRALTRETFNLMPDVQVDVQRALDDIGWVGEVPAILDIAPIELLASLKGQINPKAYSQYTKASRDRSAALWLLECEAFRAGCTRDQVYWLAEASANNKFKERKYYASVDLRKDILRAESRVTTLTLDLKALIMDLRQSKGELVSARRLKMSKLVINHMREQGEFVHTQGGTLWYLRSDTGRPIMITTHSQWLWSYLSTIFGLNPTEAELKYVVQDLISFARNLAQSNNLQTLSFYDSYRQTLALHTGGRDVLHINKDGVTVHANGYANVVFQWGVLGESFVYDANAPALELPWWRILFQDSFNNLVGISRDEALVVMRSWFLFLLFRHMATTRPLLAWLGQPGSGKTTCAKILYRLLYGRHKSVSGLSSAEDFDMDASTMPFITFDNCDTFQSWLPDRLAQSSGNTAITKRQLYTDMDVVHLERQALVALTAHNPRFTREDITDRLILLMFHRLTEFKSETAILERVSARRTELWIDIVRDVQKVLRTAKPAFHEVPQFRIEDFANLGAWFAKAEGDNTLELFRSAIPKIQAKQRSLNIEEDYTLVAALQRWLAKRPADVDTNDAYIPSSAVWTNLNTYAQDGIAFQRQYKNAQTLNRKLWVMQESLKSILDIDCKDDSASGTRVWRIKNRE